MEVMQQTPKTVFVTGASRGIGRAVALHLAEHTDMRLVLLGRDGIYPVKRMCDRIRPTCAEAWFWNAMDWHADEVRDDMPGPIAVVHCAAVLGEIDRLHDAPDAAEVIHANLIGTVLLCQGVLPQMVREKAGRIILFSGGGACEARPRFAAYAASKAGVLRLTETVAEEYAGDNIQCVAVAPGAVETDMLRQCREAGDNPEKVLDISEPVRLVHRLLTEDIRGLSGRLVHSRDEWASGEVIPGDAWKLRRIQYLRINGTT